MIRFCENYQFHIHRDFSTALNYIELKFASLISRSVTEAAGRLQHAGYIRYRRGHIAVLDRSGLEARTCECYAVVKAEFSRLLSDVRYQQGMLTVVR